MAPPNKLAHGQTKPWVSGVPRFKLSALDCRAINSLVGPNIERVTMKASKTSVPAPSAPEPEFTVNSLDELKDSLRRVDGLVQQSDGSSTIAGIERGVGIANN